MGVDFDYVIKKITSTKRLFQKLHFKLISLVMSDKFAMVICHSNKPHTISSSELNEGKAEGESCPAGTTEPQKSWFE